MSAKWIVRLLITVLVMPFAYVFFPNPMCYLPRLLFGANRELYGTYEGYVVPDSGADTGVAGDRMLVRVRVMPTLYVDTGNTYGYTWQDYTQTRDGLDGWVEVQETNGRRDRYELHGHEQEEGETGPTFLVEGGAGARQLAVSMQGKGLRVEGVIPVPRLNDATSGGTLVKR